MSLQLLTMKRNDDGTFKRTRTPFSLDNFDDGYVDADGRFRVYLPDHPRADKQEGYVLRSIVAYELYHKLHVPETMAIHHIDGTKLNDSEENLAMLLFGQHSSFHNKSKEESLIPRQCKQCGITFFIKKWRLNERSRGQFCSQKCYQQYPRSEAHKQNISKGLQKAFAEGRR